MSDAPKDLWLRLPLLDMTDLSVGRFPGRGNTYYLNLAGHNVQIYLTEKKKRVRVFIDHKEWKPHA